MFRRNYFFLMFLGIFIFNRHRRIYSNVQGIFEFNTLNTSTMNVELPLASNTEVYYIGISNIHQIKTHSRQTVKQWHYCEYTSPISSNIWMGIHWADFHCLSRGECFTGIPTCIFCLSTSTISELSIHLRHYSNNR